MRQKDGRSLRDHLQEVQRQTGVAPAELAGPEFPAAADYLWRWFIELHAARQSAGFGPAPLAWTDLSAYFALRGERPARWELETIQQLDRIALEQTAAKPPESGRSARPAVAGAPPRRSRKAALRAGPR